MINLIRMACAHSVNMVQTCFVQVPRQLHRRLHVHVVLQEAPVSPVARALILLWLSEFFCISEFVFAFQKTQVIFVQIKITSMQNVQLDKTNILLSCLLILDKYNLSSGKIEL